MPLPSQTVHSGSRRTHMYRRSRRRPARRLMSTVMVVAVLVLAAWILGPAALDRLDALRGGDTAADGANADVAGTSVPTALERLDLETARGVGPADRTAAPLAREQASAPLVVPPPSIEMGGRPVAPSDAAPADAARPDASSTVSPPVASGASPRTASAAAGPEPIVDRPAATPATGRDRGAATPTTSRGIGHGTSNPTSLQLAQQGIDLIAANRPVEGRRALSDVLERGGLSPADQASVRDALARVNERLVFGPEILPGDRFSLEYVIRSGDVLSDIPREMNLLVPWQLIQRVNGIDRPERIRVGQRIKLVTGPFHAVVHKSDYRMDVYLGDGDERVFVRSFRVGLGEHDGTPIGRFRIGTKASNPDWRNPRTGEYFPADDPANPIGERWLALVPDEDRLKDATSYGIHGTIDPDSIGDQRSMGCVRLGDDDVALVYDLLRTNASTVIVRR